MKGTRKVLTKVAITGKMKEALTKALKDMESNIEGRLTKEEVTEVA